MNRFKIILIISILLTIRLHSQNYYPVGGGLNYAVQALYADTVNNYLVVGGQFSMAGGNTPCHGLVKWDGTSWESWSDNVYYGGANSIIEFNGEKIIGGGYTFYDSINNQFKNYTFVKWDSIAGELAIVDSNIDGMVYKLLLHNNEVYLGGQFKTAGGIYSPKIVRYDGQQFHAMPLLDTAGGGWAVNALIFYNGELYVGGNFEGMIGSPQKRDMARLSNGQWHKVGTGFQGGGFVKDFCIYQGKLIVAGYFNTAWGDPGNGVAAWDGSTWTPVGSNLAFAYARCLTVYNGELWVGGGLTLNSGNGVNLLKLVGNQWIVPGNIPNGGTVDTFTELNDDLYIGGGLMYPNDTARFLYKYNGLTGIQAVYEPQSSFQIFPNPATETITLQHPLTKITGHATVYNFLGEAVQQLTLLPNTTRQQLNIAHLPAGLYLIKAEAEGKSGVKRFIKE